MNEKILVLGLGQNNFLSYLYSKLKKAQPGIRISAPFAIELNHKVSHEQWMYNNETIKRAGNPVAYARAFFEVIFTTDFYSIFLFILFFEGKLGKALHFFWKFYEGKVFFLQNNNFNDYDVFHFHYMQYSYLRELFLVPKSKKIVCTFWGSDLLRTSDSLNHFIVQKALRRADVITCQSLEMREIILSKYGRNLLSKIKIALFPYPEDVFKGIDKNRSQKEKLISFKEKYSYSIDKINVLIGHNGNPANNHLQIIESIGQLKFKERLHFIVNLNYGVKENERESYKLQIVAALEKAGVSFNVLECFFTQEDLILSRLATEVMIHTPLSDALSGTIVELMYAGNILITGSWLPYKTLSRTGLKYSEVDSIESLGANLEYIIGDFSNYKILTQKNPEIIDSTLLSDDFMEIWLGVLSVRRNILCG